MIDGHQAPTGIRLVVVHHGADTLPGCVESLLTVPGIAPTAIVVVDNAGTAAAALGPHRGIEILRPGRNLGFARGGAGAPSTTTVPPSRTTAPATPCS